MSIEIVEKSHPHAFLDPAPCFDLYQSLILLGGILYIPAFLWDTSKTSHSPGWLFVAVFTALMIPWVVERVLDSLARRNETGCSALGIVQHVRIIGRPAQVRRVIHMAQHRTRLPTTFRTSLQQEVQFSLLFTTLVLLPGLVFFTEVSHWVISVIASTVYGMAILQVFFRRSRFGIANGKIHVMQLRGIRTFESQAVDLAKAEVVIDFPGSCVALRTTEEQLCIRLDELMYPNRFAAALVANIRA